MSLVRTQPGEPVKIIKMIIQYLDDYEEELLEVESSYMPQVGNSVLIGNTDEWIVQQVTWNADSNIGVVRLKLSEDIRTPRETKVDDSGRLREMSNAIIQINKRLDESDKKARLTRDSLSSVRSHVKRNTPKPSKDPNVTN